MDPSIQHYRSLLQAAPRLREVIETLNQHHIQYGIYSGSYVYIATGERVPRDIDVLVADHDIPKIKGLFPACECVDKECCLFLYPFRDHKIEIVSRSVVQVGGAEYHFKLTDLAWKHTREIRCDDLRVRLCNPVDTILLKATLQRGKTEGKFDFSDIEALLRSESIDRQYLRARVREFGFTDRLLQALRSYQLSVNI